MRTFALVNHSNKVTDDDLARYAAAYQEAMNDLVADWRLPKTEVVAVPHGERAPAGSWPVFWLGGPADVADALGYHDVDANGVPYCRVFVDVDRQYGLSDEVTGFHEIAETAVNPRCDKVRVFGGGRHVATEVGDPVEADRYARKIHGVLVSDWVTRGWFDPRSKGPFDWADRCTKPRQMLPGGYLSIEDADGRWTQVTARTLPGVTSRRTLGHRLEVLRTLNAEPGLPITAADPDTGEELDVVVV